MKKLLRSKLGCLVSLHWLTRLTKTETSCMKSQCFGFTILKLVKSFHGKKYSTLATMPAQLLGRTWWKCGFSPATSIRSPTLGIVVFKITWQVLTSYLRLTKSSRKSSISNMTFGHINHSNSEFKKVHRIVMNLFFTPTGPILPLRLFPSLKQGLLCRSVFGHRSKWFARNQGFEKCFW